MKGNKIIVPKKLYNSIIAEAHTGQSGISTTTHRIRRTLFWNGLTADVKNYVNLAQSGDSNTEFLHHITHDRKDSQKETYIQTVKNTLKRCWRDGSDPYLAMLLLRNTPRNDVLKSPNERLFSRQTRSILPNEVANLKPKNITGVTEELKELRLNQKRYVDKIAVPRVPFEIGNEVRMQTNHREWQPARVVEITQNPRSVIVETPDGRKYRRNNTHLHKTRANIPTSINIPTQSSPDAPSNDAQASMNLGSPSTPSVTNDNRQTQRVATSAASATSVSNTKRSRYGRAIRPVVKFDPSNQ